MREGVYKFEGARKLGNPYKMSEAPAIRHYNAHKLMTVTNVLLGEFLEAGVLSL